MSGRKDLARVIKLTAQYYNRQLDPEVLSMMCDDLEDLGYEASIQAYAQYRKNSANRFFPMPAQIRDMISPQPSDENDARDAAARIVQAISKFGWANQTGAKSFIGDLGWTVVERHGGWLTVCEMPADQIGIFQAQGRELAKAIAVRASAGLLDEPPRLPEAKARSDIFSLPNKSINEAIGWKKDEV
jgi:hypothetical protein